MLGKALSLVGYRTAVESGDQRHGLVSWLLARRPERGPASDSAVDEADGPPTEDKAPDHSPRSGLGWIRSWAIIVLIVVAGAFLLRTYVVETYYIPSASMEPTLHGCPTCQDDRVLVEKISYLFGDPERGDVVVFNRPTSGPWARDITEKVLIKRVIGVGGDRIVIRHGHVFRDGQRLAESYVNPACGQGTQAPRHVYRVPPNDVFVMGDNRCRSEDSRFNGPVPVSDVVGRAFLIVWPLGRVRLL